MNKFLKRIMELGAAEDRAVSDDERKIINTEAESLYEKHIKELEEDKFPNGFESWHETHYEIISNGIVNKMDIYGTVAQKRHDEQGTGGLYELAQEMTDKFELEYKGQEWGVDVDFYDEIDKFIDKNL